MLRTMLLRLLRPRVEAAEPLDEAGDLTGEACISHALQHQVPRNGFRFVALAFATVMGRTCATGLPSSMAAQRIW